MLHRNRTFLKFSLPLIIILFVSILFRFIWLDRIPTGVSGDELDYILNAKAVFLTGSDISGTWNPLSLTTPGSSSPQAEIPPLLTFWLIGPLPLSLFYSKLPYALNSAGIVLLIYLITKKLIGEKEAFFTGLVAAINPWLLFFGRTAYDTPLAISAFLFALYIMLIARGWRILLAFPFLLIGFYSYIGTKLIFLPFAFITILFSWYFVSKKKFTKQYLTLFSLCILMFGFFIFLMLHIPGSRTNELSTPNMPTIVETVNRERRLSVHTPLTPVFSNKYSVFAKYSLEKYFGAFSPNFLFLSGDGKSLFSVWDHGVFYYIDAIFLLVGISVLYKKNKRALFLLGAIAIIAPLPSVLSNVGTSYAIRSLLLCPILIIFIGVGIHAVITFRKDKIYRTAAVLCIIAVYSLLILNFINIYFFRNPISNSESFGLSGRIVARYLSFQNQPVYIINGHPRSPFKQYLFYTDQYNRGTSEAIARAFKKDDFRYNNLYFKQCEDMKNIPANSLLIYADPKCKFLPETKNNLTIAQLGDGGGIYTIANDTTCSRYKLNRYPYGLTISDLNIEKLSEQQFCQKFITKY